MRWGDCVFVVIKGEINDVSPLLTKIVWSVNNLSYESCTWNLKCRYV